MLWNIWSFSMNHIRLQIHHAVKLPLTLPSFCFGARPFLLAQDWLSVISTKLWATKTHWVRRPDGECVPAKLLNFEGRHAVLQPFQSNDVIEAVGKGFSEVWNKSAMAAMILLGWIPRRKTVCSSIFFWKTPEASNFQNSMVKSGVISGKPWTNLQTREVPSAELKGATWEELRPVRITIPVDGCSTSFWRICDGEISRPCLVHRVREVLENLSVSEWLELENQLILAGSLAYLAWKSPISSLPFRFDALDGQNLRV